MQHEEERPKLGHRIRPAAMISLVALTFFFTACGAGLALLYYPVLKVTRTTVQTYLVAIRQVLFPETVKWKKTYLPLEMLFFGLLAVNMVLELPLFPLSPVKAISHFEGTHAPV